MSVLKKTPWIQAKLSTLDSEKLGELLSEFNSTSQITHKYSLVHRNMYIPALEDDDDYLIQNCTLETEIGKPSYTGYLIHTASMFWNFNGQIK